MIRFIQSFMCLFLGGLLYMIPNMTRRGILFTVNVPPGFRESPEGRESVSSFRRLLGLVVLIDLLAIAFSPMSMMAPVMLVSPLLIIAVAAWGFVRQRRKIEPFAVPRTVWRVRQAELSGEPDRLPWFAWLGAVPFAFLAAAGAYLYANWDRIPAEFPVHWGANGQPNRWQSRTVHGVYGPLFFAAELCLFFVTLALAGWYGARRSYMRRVILGTMVAVECMMGMLFAGIAINSIAQFPIWVIILVPLAVMGFIVIMSVNRISETDEAAEPAPEEFWHAQIFYYNPGDPALLVEKRTGMGYTLNFGNVWSWLLMAALVAIIGTIPILL